MAFDPDAFLGSSSTPAPTTTTAEPAASTFNPDAFLSEPAPAPRPAAAPTRRGGLGGLLTNSETIFDTAAQRHGLDPLMLKSIAALETDNGKSRALRAHNNPGGLMRPDNPHQFQTFATLDEGVDAMASLLSRNYVKKGLTTIEAIGAKYSPPGASNDPNGTNHTWPSGVRSWMKRLGGSDAGPAQPAFDPDAFLNPPAPERSNVGSEFMGTLAKNTADTVAGAMRSFERGRTKPRPLDPFEVAQQHAALVREGRIGEQIAPRAAGMPSPGMEQAIQFTSDVAGDSRAAWGAPELPPQDVPAQIARGAGNVVAMLPALTLGIPVGVAQGGALAYEQGFQGAVANGADEEEAHAAASTAAVQTVPALAAYLVGGRLAAGAVAKLLPEASPIAKALAGTAAATAANVASSTAIKAVHGDPLMPTAEGLTQDVLFGMIHGAGEYSKAQTVPARPDMGIPITEQAPLPARPEAIIPPDFADGLTTGVDPQTLAGYDAFANVERRRIDLPQPPPPASAEAPLPTARSAGPLVENRPEAAPAPAPDAVARVEQPAVDQSAGAENPPASGDVAGTQPQRKSPRRFSIASADPFFEHPLVDLLVSNGGLMSKSMALKKWGKEKFERNKGEFEDAGRMANVLHHALYRPLGLTPDEATQFAVDAGLLPANATPPDLHRALWDISQAAARTRKQRTSEAAQVKEMEQQGKKFAKEVTDPKKPDAPAIPVDELAIGDVVKVGEETLKVTAIDPETFDVTLEDGKRYGVQEVKAGEVIYGEHEPAPDAPDAFADLPGEVQVANESVKPSRVEMVDPQYPFITALVHPSARKPGTWQGTVMGPEGPAQHIEGATQEAIIESLKGNGFVTAESVRSKPEPGFNLETQTEADVQAARDAAAAKAKIDEGMARKLTGSAGDLTSDMFGATEGETPLFNARRDQVLGDPAPARSMGNPIDPALSAAEQRVLGAPPLSGRHALTMAMEGEGNVSIPQVLDSFAGIVRAAGGETPIRIGRFLQRALGIYKPGADVARIGNAGNLRTGAHEIAHALQNHLYGNTDSGVLHARLPADVVTELVNQGRAIYPKPPANGWASEGWAETWANYLTSDGLPTIAPKTMAWLEKTFLPAQTPAFQEAVRAAKASGDLWRNEGAPNRNKAQMPKGLGAVGRFRERAAGYLGANRWVEEFAPLKNLADEYSKATGKKLSPSTNPYEVASARRGSSGAVVMQMALHGMVDLNGNLKRTSSGRLVGSMQEILKPARGLEDEFALYVWARHAVEVHAAGKDPGMTLPDAQYLVGKYDQAHADFAPMAQRLYDWQSAVLDYLVEANPSMAPNVAAMRATWQNYVPLSRVMESGSARKLAGVAAASPFARLKGSGRQVKPIFDQILMNTQRIVSAAHKAQVLNTVVRMASVQGMGRLIEGDIARDRIRNTVPIDKLRKQLEDMGVDTTTIPDGEMLSFYTLAETPTGSDPIFPIKVNGETKWFHLDPELYDVLSGLEPTCLSPLADLFLGVPARAFRLGTTGLRASFGLVTNPARDFQTLMGQTMASDNPARVLSAYLGAFVDVVRGGPGKQLFQQLAVEGGQPLGMDVPFTRKAGRGLFSGPVREVVAHPVEFLRSMLNFMEGVPRIAEMKMTAENIGYVWGTPMTADQAVTITNAGKRVTTDFSAGGDIAKRLNQAIPFFNASTQGARTFARLWKERPVTAAVRSLAYFVAPSLALWAMNRDEKWYQDLPWRERYQYWNFSPDGKNVIQLPRPQEWGALASIAEGAADSWARRDPRGIKEAMVGAVHTVWPLDYPVLLKAAKQGWQNRIDFFDKPIVPRGEVDLPPGDQFAPYTSTIAKSLGRAFPETISPRHIDAAVRAVFGGLGGDVLSRSDDLIRMLGLNPALEQEQREWEQSDLPVIGRVFRRGGISSGSNQTLADFWDTYLEIEARAKSKVHPLDAREMFYRQSLKSAHEIIKVQEKVANATTSLSARQSLYQSMAEVAKTALDARPPKK